MGRVIFFIVLTAASAALADGSVTKRLPVGDMIRAYDLYLPTGTVRAAVVNLPGYGGEKANPNADLLGRLGARGFAYVAPHLTKDSKGKFSSNVGYPSQRGMAADDTRFLVELAAVLRRDLKVRRVCLTGVSNGGEMCYQMAYRAPGAYDAIASVAGLTLETLAKRGKPKGSVRFLEIHGTADGTSPWQGNAKGGYWGNFLAVPEAVARIAAANGCATNAVVRPCPRVKKGTASLLVHPGPVDALLVKVDGGGHGNLNDCLDLWGVLLDFFEGKITGTPDLGDSR